MYSWDINYLSIGITKHGQRVFFIPIPWVQTAHAYNMKVPDVFIAPEDLCDHELMEKIMSFHIVGCYVLTSLDDYSFLANLKEARDIFIAEAINLNNLSFLSTLGEWKMLFIEGAHLKDLEPIYQSSEIERMWPAFCLCFANCEVDDTSALNKMSHISELIVMGVDDDDERAKWKDILARTYRYYCL